MEGKKTQKIPAETCATFDWSFRTPEKFVERGLE